MKVKKVFFLVIILIIIGITIITIKKNNSTNFNIIDKVTSPDKKVEAILIRENEGATTSYSYKIYIRPTNSKFKKEGELFVADHVKNLKVKWIQNKMLQISYDKARIFHFTNFWHSEKVKNFKYVVELKLKPRPNGFALSKKDRYKK